MAEKPAPTTQPDAPATVKIRCTSDRQPWTDKAPLALGEVAEVPADVAAILIRNKQAEKAPADAPVGVSAGPEA